MTTSTLRSKDDFGGRNKHNHTMPSLLSKEEQEACSSNNNKAAATTASACSPAPSSFARTSASTSSSSQLGTSTTKVEPKPVEATTGATTTKSSTTATAVAASSTGATATTKAATTTATTPFQLSQRPRQITPPGVTIDSSFSISPSNNGDYALVSHSFGGTVTSSSPLTSSVRSETNGAAGKNSHTANNSNSSTAEVSPSLRGGSSTTLDPEGRQEGDHHDDRQGSSLLGGEKSPMKSAVGGNGNSGSSSSAGLPSLSLEEGQQRDPTVDVTSSWDDFAVLSFMSSPILKKKDTCNKSSSNDKDSPSTATSSAVVAVHHHHHHLPDRQRSYFHHQLDHHQAHYHGFSPSPPPSKGSARSSSSRHYDVWERMNPTMGNVGFGSRGGGHKAGGPGNNPVLPFVASHERPANMQRQHLLRLPPLTSSPSRGPKLSSSSSAMDQPPTSVLTSPHMLYGWLRTRFAAGLVRSSFNILHDMLTKDYQQAKTLLGKIHQDQPRSEVYISELLTLRDHLAGLWCVYAHFALDVGRLTRTIQDDEPFPAPSAATATKGAAPKGKKNVGPSLSSNSLLKGPASDENDSAAFVKRNSSTYGGALRLQMINSPVRPTKRKRKKTTKAVESEENDAQLDEVEATIAQKMSNKASAASGATATTKSKNDDDEYIPKKLTSNNPRRKKKRLKTDHGSTSAKKKRPASKQSKTSDAQEAAKKKTGHWTKAEHERFLEGIAMYGRGKWKAIADVVKTRTTVQVKTHGQSYFRDDGTHHIQTIDSTPEQKVVSRKMRTKENNTKKPSEGKDGENRTPVQDDGNDAVPRKSLRPDRRTVLSYEDDREEDFDDDGSDIDINDTAAATLATPVPKSRIAPPPLTPIVPTPQHHPPSLMTSPYMGTTSISNLEDLVLGGGLFSPSEFSQVDRLQTVEGGAQNIDHLATPRTFGRSLDAALSLSEGPKDTPLSERKSTPRQTAISGLTPPRPVLRDRFLDDMPPYMRGFFTSVGILSTDQLVKTPTKNLSEIYMSYQRDQTNAVVSSAPSEVPSAHVGDKVSFKKATNKKASKDGTYQDIAGFALSVLLAARKCPLVGNHHFIVLAMGRMIVSTAPMEKTPNGTSHVDVPTAIITSRINSAITASWDGVRSCHGCAVDENKIFFQDPESATKAISLLASLDFDGKKKISEDKIRNSVLREEMNSIFSFPSILRKDAGRPEGFVFNDRHAVLALLWELNRWSRLEEKLRTNKSGKSVRIGESPWCQPTYQIEDLPMLATVDAITDSWNNCVFAKGDKDSSTVVWEW
mmetsp:Transcript_22492/g.53106  ORF Transcript_22492/g.53106 Transcript_22492/m.53106 type:complete len:1283 (-) Transcript_22492:81-3929(-)